MRGFHTGDRVQATVTAHRLSLLPDVDGLHGPPVPVCSGSGLDLCSFDSQSIECWDFCACTAIPFLGPPVFTAYLCSVILFFMVLLVSSMYVSWQSRQGTPQITFLFLSIGVFCFTCITMFLSVFWGLKMVFTPKGAHTFSSFSLTPLTYSRNIGLAVSSSVSFSLDLGAEEKVLLTVLSGIHWL